MKPKPRACGQCKEIYQPRNSLQKACSLECALVDSRSKQAKEAKKVEKIERSKHLARKRALKTVSQHLADTQTVFNKFIRLRDKDLPCVSCGRHHTGQYHAGHFQPRGMNSALRFHELNCWKQCAPCNNHKSGNITLYREELVKRIGEPMVEWLENNNEIKKWTIEEANDLKAYYRLQIKGLE